MKTDSEKFQTVLVTGGAGFIGSNFVLNWLRKSNGRVVNLDLLTYSGNLMNLSSLEGDDRHVFIKGGIGDRDLVASIFDKYQPQAVINFAAESHVDRSITDPEIFAETNVTGTFHLLDESYKYWSTLVDDKKQAFRFLHVSTDEVYGSLGPDEPAFTENKQFEPNSPYSASKAASDHFVRAYNHTYGLPVLTTNCSNNYGPFQFPEKLIPLVITNALKWKPLPIYGDGMNVRDWLFVIDHCDAIEAVLSKGQVGETYNIGGDNELANIDMVRKICNLLDELSPASQGSYQDLITFVTDRPGHDRRYAMNINKISSQLGWSPAESCESGLRKTVGWYLENREWIETVTSGAYRDWIHTNYSGR